MWFKNLLAYRLPADWSLSAGELEQQLARRTLAPCAPFDMSSRGWVAPSPTGALVHSVNQQHMIALGFDQKLLPGSIIRQVTAERAAKQAQEQGFPVRRRQLRDLKMRVTEELRARALARRRVMRAWIDPVNGWFVVDAASPARAEELVETLRETLGGSFAVAFPDTDRSPQQAMASWLTVNDAPGRFSIDQDLELQTADPIKATVRYTRHPLDVREVQGHLKSGKYPLRLGLAWGDRIAFVLTDKLQLKRVQFLGMKSEATDAEEVDPAEQFDIDFAIMSGELAQLLAELYQALGSEELKKAAA